MASEQLNKVIERIKSAPQNPSASMEQRRAGMERISERVTADVVCERRSAPVASTRNGSRRPGRPPIASSCICTAEENKKGKNIKHKKVKNSIVITKLVGFSNSFHKNTPHSAAISGDDCPMANPCANPTFLLPIKFNKVPAAQSAPPRRANMCHFQPPRKYSFEGSKGSPMSDFLEKM